MNIARKGFAVAAGAFATTGILRFPAGAAEFSFKYGTDWPADHPISARSAELAAKITQESGGRIEMRFFPNAQLGSSADMTSQVRLGALEFACIGDNVIATSAPPIGLTAIPFAFASHKDAWAATDGALGKYARAAALKSNLFAFERSWDGGFRQVTNNSRPIHTPADLRGLKIRVPVAPVPTATFKALGAEVAAIDGSQMYVACQTHLVDGTELPLPTLVSFKMYEVQKYVSVINYTWTGYTAIASPAIWRSLPKNLQELVERNFIAGANNERADIVKLDATSAGILKDRGMLINDADIPSFKATIKNAGLYSQWRDTYGAEGWAALEQAVGKLT